MEKTTRRLRKEKVTIGLDLGDKRHTFCVLDRRGEILKKGWLHNERKELAKLVTVYLGALRQGSIRLGSADFLTLLE
jgi:hypothetical protein